MEKQMTKPNDTGTTTRRGFLQKGGSLAAGATMLGGAVPAVHAAENNTIRLALIGCGPRGRGAVANAAFDSMTMNKLHGNNSISTVFGMSVSIGCWYWGY
jgi:hypothetical protein